jgi:hypothetical protein
MSRKLDLKQYALQFALPIYHSVYESRQIEWFKKLAKAAIISQRLLQL